MYITDVKIVIGLIQLAIASILICITKIKSRKTVYFLSFDSRIAMQQISHTSS